MKILSIGTDRKIFEENAAVRQRMVEYGKIFNELHLVVFTPCDSKFQNQKLSDNAFLYPTNSKKRIFYIFDYLRVVKKILTSSDSQQEIVISTQDPFETGLVGLWLKIRYKLPLQVQLHTDFLNKYFITHNFLNFLRFPLGVFVLSFADSVRVVSNRVAKSISSLTNNVSILPIQNELKEENIETLKDKGNINILAVCRLEKEKNLETAIRAFKKVLENGIDAIFTIVGDGGQKERLEALSLELGIKEKIIFAGWQNDVSHFYKEADIFISTSLYEGYGMAMVEAAFYGLALILSDAGVAGEMFRDGESAFVCKPKDIDDFAQKIIKLCSNNDLRIKMGIEAKSVAHKHQINFTEYLNRYKDSVIQAANFYNLKQSVFKRNILLRYFTSGITSAGTQIGLLYIFTDIVGLWYIYSSILAFAVAVVTSFILQKFWTFNNKEIKRAHRQFLGYLIIAILGVIANTAFMYLFVDIFGIWYILAQIITGGIIMFFNFLMYKFFIFNK